MPQPDSTRSDNVATIIFPSVPATILLGLDILAITPSARFLGITGIPEGWHFLYGGANAALSTRTGFWFYVPTSSPSRPWQRLFQWSASTESLEPIWNEDEHRTWRTRLQDRSNREVHGRLLPYYFDPTTLHASSNSGFNEALSPTINIRPLTNHINASLLNHMTSANLTPTLGLWLLSTSSSAQEDRDEIPGLPESERTFTSGQQGMVLGEERELSFLGINLKQTWQTGAVGRERTIDARDRSAALERIVATHRTSEAWGSVVLGELQVTFLMLLLLANWSCFEEWKRTVELVLTCRALVSQRSSFFAEFLRIMLAQLQRCSDVQGGLFDVDGDGAGFLKQLLRQFRQMLKEEEDSENHEIKQVMSQMNHLEDWIRQEWGWVLNSDGILKKGMIELEDGEQVEVEMDGFDAEDESGEYAPVIVDLGE